jgi:methyl-accepting chemotaxis protein
MQERLTEIVGNVKAASDNVASGSQQMSSSAEEIARNTNLPALKHSCRTSSARQSSCRR